MSMYFVSNSPETFSSFQEIPINNKKVYTRRPFHTPNWFIYNQFGEIIAWSDDEQPINQPKGN